MSEPLRLALLFSGGGSTASAIITRFKNSEKVLPVCAIASKASAGLQNLIDAGMQEHDIKVISPKSFACPEDFGKALLQVFDDYKVNFIGQYGWLVKTPVNVINLYKDRIINQHPGPIEFGGKGMYGKHVHQARIDFAHKTGEWWTEAICHKVEEEYDTGEIIARARVEILKDDDAQSLAARVLPVEHALQIKCLEMLS